MKASSFCAQVFSFLGFTTLSAISVFAQSADLKNDLQSSFTKFDVVRIDSGGELRTEGSNKTLTVRTDGRTFDLVVTPNDILSSRYRAEDNNMVGVAPLNPPTITTYKGTIAGEPDSKVRLTIDGVSVEGFFEDSGGRRFIEPATKYSELAQAGDSVIYRAEDSLKDNTFLCEMDVPGKLEIGRQFAEAGRIESDFTLRFLELATDADLEFVNALGGPAAANNEIIGILNMVEGTYNTQLNLSIRVVYQHTWSAADPFGAADMSGVLNNFVNYWNANFTNIPRDAAHLFTAKSVALSRGLAYVGVICRSPSVSYGLSGRVSWSPGKFLVTAHEIGHNLGADHAEAAQNCANTLMNASLSNTTLLSFCPLSRDSITAYVSTNNSCLSEGPPPPPTPTPTPTATPISTPTPTPTPTPPTATPGGAPFDFDGDGRSDISVFRPADGVWYLNRSGSGFASFHFGLNGDQPVAADYDGDGIADAAVFRAGVWYRLRSTTNTMDVASFGLPTDIPAPADYDGDGKADVGVFRAATGVWYSLASGSGAFSATRFGLSGDVPLPGDYDGDGRDDINLFRPSTGTWYRLDSWTGGFTAMNFGLNGDKALAGDFDGDGRSDIAVWRPSDGVWYALRSSTGAFSATAFGLAGDVPSPADYDGDGKTDICVFRPSNGTWYRLNSSNGSFAAAAFGLSSDVPVPSYYVR
ncbi:MAG TPA: FG-GAP-like repeat-containing protein [Pyrinomonadaceae bacterium]|nr:FG-GAP-like repeat-containing protein [Pyrinomonadaceae bacterium]